MSQAKHTPLTFTFAGWDCPCGAPQYDPDRLYCHTCSTAMAFQVDADYNHESDGDA